MSEEEQDEGQVSYKVYWAYFKSGSGLLSILILITLAAAEAMNQYQSVRPKPAPYTRPFSTPPSRGNVHAAVVQPAALCGLAWEWQGASIHIVYGALVLYEPLLSMEVLLQMDLRAGVAAMVDVQRHPRLRRESCEPR